MSAADARSVLEQFRSVADTFSPFVYHEVTAHPDFVTLLEQCREFSNDPEATWDTLATNGYGVARAAEPEGMLRRLRDFGMDRLSFTLHGLELHHDWFVCRRGAYEDIWEAARLCDQVGLAKYFNIFLDRRNVANLGPLLEQTGAAGANTGREAGVSVSVPAFVANHRSHIYEETLRPRLSDLEPVRHHLEERWGGLLEQYTEAFLTARMLDSCDTSHPTEKSSPGREVARLVVDGAFDVYEKPWLFEHGLVKLGNLKTDGLSAVLDRYAARKPPSYPDVADLARRYGDPESTLVHRRAASLHTKWIARWLAEQGLSDSAGLH
jgi:MoaA/NifB/PqqE/SkfB family radical SAM enzyme